MQKKVQCRINNRPYSSLVPRPVCAIRVTRGGLEPSAIARGRPGRIFPTSLTGDVTSEIAEDDWERGWPYSRYPPSFGTRSITDSVGYIRAHVMWFRRRQTNVKIYRYKKSQTENEELFTFKTILANHIGGRDHFFSFGCGSNGRCPHSK